MVKWLRYLHLWLLCSCTCCPTLILYVGVGGVAGGPVLGAGDQGPPGVGPGEVRGPPGGLGVPHGGQHLYGEPGAGGQHLHRHGVVQGEAGGRPWVQVQVRVRVAGAGWGCRVGGRCNWWGAGGGLSPRGAGPVLPCWRW